MYEQLSVLSDAELSRADYRAQAWHTMCVPYATAIANDDPEGREQQRTNVNRSTAGGCDAAGRTHTDTVCRVQQHSGRRLYSADSQGGERQERGLLDLVHDVVPVS